MNICIIININYKEERERERVELRIFQLNNSDSGLYVQLETVLNNEIN